MSEDEKVQEKLTAPIKAGKFQLPLFEDKTMLPTGKYHVSYSEISDWLDCSERHKLKHILKISLDKPSIHTEYGRAIHDAMEQYILNRIMPDATTVNAEFDKLLEQIKTEHGVLVSDAEAASFKVSTQAILTGVPKFLDEDFPGWHGHAAELALFESIPGQTNKSFKGFIDTVLRMPRKAPKTKRNADPDSKNPPMRLSEMVGSSGAAPETTGSEFEYYIIDWKTTSWGWAPDKKRDFQKQLQLALYKHFFCKLMNVPLDQVKCGFVLLKRTPRKSDGSCVEYVPVSVGPKTEEKAVAILHDMINQIQTGRTIKNRNSCRYCAYHNTEHCT